MGVPKFYRWISERYPCLSEVVADEQVPEFDNLYLDMNGIIHGCSHPDDDDVSFRISEEQIFRDIFHYIDTLFGIIRPRKVFFMAIDGVAPRAKMNQQRARRFMSAKNAQEALQKAKSKGVELPEEKPFDSNCITPGTEFMARLHEQLKYFVKMKITMDSCWQGLRIYLSGHNCPGEGEHKIMDFIRSERSRPDYDANTRHCLYGLDADLIMLGMCSHEPHFALLREEVKFGRPKNRFIKNQTGVDGTTFHLLHLSLLREYLSWEFHSLQANLPFEYNLESLIDDWVLMGFLVGNDFIPHLPHVHIHEDALPLLYATYIDVLPQLDGYINEAGILNLKRFEIFLKNFAKNDRRNFIEQMDDEAYLASKRISNAWASSAVHDDLRGSNENLKQSNSSDVVESVAEKLAHKGAFDSDSDISNDDTKNSLSEELSYGCFGISKDSDEELPVVLLDDGIYDNDCDFAWTPSVNRAFKNHKRDYYNDKMKYNNISKGELREQAEGYVRAVQWNLHYYYHGCCSWSWFYPHHYAPYISDVTDFADMEMNFELNEPFHPFEQLLAVLPAASAECLPLPLQELMRDPTSPIIDFYPEEFHTDLNGKKNDWEAVVLIPFIKEDRLLKAVATKEPLLNYEERQRNSHGPHLLFSYDPASCHIAKSSLPGIYPDIHGCTAQVQEIGMNEFRIAHNRVVHGLLPGVKLDVVFPGFPTMKHIKHTAELHFADIKVFQQPSKKQSMILKVVSRPDFEKDMLELAFDLVGNEVHVNWPLLQKALVQELWTTNKKYCRSSEEIICYDLSKEEQDIYSSYVIQARRNEFERRGIDTGEQKCLALVRRARGSRKSFNGQHIVTERCYADCDDAFPVSLSLLVQNILEDSDEPCSTEDAFPLNSEVFIVSAESKYYGFSAHIKENQLETKGTLTVACSVPLMASMSFYDLIANYDNYALKWYSAYDVAKYLRSTADVVSRITGCVFVSLEESPTEPSKNGRTNKFNIGLELKFSKRNQIIPDFTRRSLEGYWMYSLRALDLIRIYKIKFPGVFRYLEKLEDFKGYIHVKQLFPEFRGKEREVKFEELKKFLRTITPKEPLESAEGSFVDSNIVKEVEKRTQMALCRSMPKCNKRLAVKPRAIFRAELCKGDIAPDPKADFRLLDRVVCVKKTHMAPFGDIGTVIGLPYAGMEKKVDVLFDKPYFGGKVMRSSKSSGARLPVSSLINITHGERVRKEIPLNEHVVKPKVSQIANVSGNKLSFKAPVHVFRSANSLPDGSFGSEKAGQNFSTTVQYAEVIEKGSALDKKQKSQTKPPRSFVNNPVLQEDQGTGAFGCMSYATNLDIYRRAERLKDKSITCASFRNRGIKSESIADHGGFQTIFPLVSQSGAPGSLSSANLKRFQREYAPLLGFQPSFATTRKYASDFVNNFPLEDVPQKCNNIWGSHKQFGFINTRNTEYRQDEFNRDLDYKDVDLYSTESVDHRQLKFSNAGNANREHNGPIRRESGKYKQFGFSGTGNVSFKQAEFNSTGNVGNTSDSDTCRESGELRRNHKLHRGCPRSWFGSKSARTEEKSGVPSGNTFSNQLSAELVRTCLAEECTEKPEGKQLSKTIVLLKRGESLNPVITELLSPAKNARNTDEYAEIQSGGGNKTETPKGVLQGNNPVNEIIQRINDQKLSTSTGLNDWGRPPQSCLSLYPPASSVPVPLTDFGSCSSHSQMEKDIMTPTQVLKKKIESAQAQNISSIPTTTAISGNPYGNETTEGESGSKDIGLHEIGPAISMPSPGSSTVARKVRRRPRKSRVAANLGLRKKEEEK